MKSDNDGLLKDDSMFSRPTPALFFFTTFVILFTSVVYAAEPRLNILVPSQNSLGCSLSAWTPLDLQLHFAEPKAGLIQLTVGEVKKLRENFREAANAGTDTVFDQPALASMIHVAGKQSTSNYWLRVKGDVYFIIEGTGFDGHLSPTENVIVNGTVYKITNAADRDLMLSRIHQLETILLRNSADLFSAQMIGGDVVVEDTNDLRRGFRESVTYLVDVIGVESIAIRLLRTLGLKFIVQRPILHVEIPFGSAGRQWYTEHLKGTPMAHLNGFVEAGSPTTPPLVFAQIIAGHFVPLAKDFNVRNGVGHDMDSHSGGYALIPPTLWSWFSKSFALLLEQHKTSRGEARNQIYARIVKLVTKMDGLSAYLMTAMPKDFSADFDFKGEVGRLLDNSSKWGADGDIRVMNILTPEEFVRMSEAQVSEVVAKKINLMEEAGSPEHRAYVDWIGRLRNEMISVLKFVAEASFI